MTDSASDEGRGMRGEAGEREESEGVRPPRPHPSPLPSPAAAPTWELVIEDIAAPWNAYGLIEADAARVIADATARAALGRARDGRDWLRAAYEGSLDLVATLKDHMLDPETAAALRKFERLYGRAIALCCDLRAELHVRDGDDPRRAT